MKKAVAAILLLIYFTVSSGFAVSLHYCMDKIASVQIGADESDKCGTCGMKSNKANSCCKDEVKLYKLQQDSLNATYAVVQFMWTPVDTTNFTYFNLLSYKFLNDHDYYAHGPPILSKQDIYLRNCVFRI